MLSKLDNFYLNKEEPIRSCLLALKNIILSSDSNISHVLKYNMPFFCLEGSMLCYLWIHKKYKKPYIGFVRGYLIDDNELLIEKRAKMKILLIDETADLPTEKINDILTKAIYFTKYNNALHMKNTLRNLSILLILAVFSSCKTYITPAALGSNIGYVPKPMVADSIRSKVYITGTYGGATSPNASVNFTFGMLEINRAHTSEDFNFSYGGYGYFGNAKYEMAKPILLTSQTLPELPSFNKNTAGLGIKTSIGYHETSKSRNVDYRLMNWENSFAWEMGDYAQFRKDLYNSAISYNNISVSNQTFIWTTGFSTEIIFRSPQTHDFKNAFRIFFGGSKGLVKSFRDSGYANDYTAKSSVAFSFTYYLQYKAFALTYEVAANNNAANKISLGYSF